MEPTLIIIVSIVGGYIVRDNLSELIPEEQYENALVIISLAFFTVGYLLYVLGKIWIV